MKYLKLYENINEITFLKWMSYKYDKNFDYSTIKAINCSNSELIDLIGIENFINLEKLNIGYNNLKNFKGIENLINIIYIGARDNKLNDISSIKNLINIEELGVGGNELKNLKGIENLTKIEKLWCWKNNFKNLDEVIFLPIIKILSCDDNPWEYPLPTEMVKKFNIHYNYDNLNRFQSYKCQKEFLEKFPERVNDLKQFEIHEKIKEEFADMIEGSEFGFFGLKN